MPTKLTPKGAKCKVQITRACQWRDLEVQPGDFVEEDSWNKDERKHNADVLAHRGFGVIVETVGGVEPSAPAKPQK